MRPYRARRRYPLPVQDLTLFADANASGCSKAPPPGHARQQQVGRTNPEERLRRKPPPCEPSRSVYRTGCPVARGYSVAMTVGWPPRIAEICNGVCAWLWLSGA
jgi:hypothetical protein